MGDYADGSRYWPPGFRTSQDLAAMADDARKQAQERGLMTPADKARELGVPVIGPLGPKSTRPMSVNPVVAVCGECGREIHQVEGYSCQNGRCPVTLRPR